MAESGVLSDKDRVELIEGVVVDMAPIGSPHAAVLSRLDRLFAGAVGMRAIVRVQLPVHLSAISEPQPDLAIVVYREDFYERAHPGPTEVLLVVEVGDTSIRFDLDKKARLYARAGITEYWVVDLTRDEIVIHRGPGRAGYASARAMSGSARLSPLTFPQQSWSVAEILGSA